MARSVKTIPEKKIDVKGVIANILTASKLKLDDFLYEVGISMDAYRKMASRGELSKEAVENILAVFDLNKGYLIGDEEELNYRGKHTHDQNKGENTLAYKEMYEKFLGASSEYVFIHKDLLKEHRLIPVKEMEQNAKESDNQVKAILDLTARIGQLAERPINIQLSDIKKT